MSTPCESLRHDFPGIAAGPVVCRSGRKPNVVLETPRPDIPPGWPPESPPQEAPPDIPPSGPVEFPDTVPEPDIPAETPVESPPPPPGG